jgi:hypothetical protein
MSPWLSNNYEKAAVGGAAVAALGLALFGWFKVGGVPEDFSAVTKGDGNNDPSVAEASLVAKATSSLARKLAWPQGESAGSRAVDLFTGIPLFIARDAPETAVDLITSPPIHPPIPNTWWIEHRLDPGFADSPSRDPDGEGFTNLEEFEGKTNPTDEKSHPPLIAKLKYENDDSLKWSIRPTFPEGENFSFKYADQKDGTLRRNQSGAGVPVKPGEMFFGAEPMKNRFKYLKLDKRREMNKAINQEVDITYAIIEDQKPNKKGTKYEIPAFPESRMDDFAKFDRSAVMTLEAAGNEGKRETIEENTRFGLPFESTSKDYLLKKVTPDEIEVEHTDPKSGEKTLYKGSKGAFPTKAQ